MLDARSSRVGSPGRGARRAKVPSRVKRRTWIAGSPGTRRGPTRTYCQLCALPGRFIRPVLRDLHTATHMRDAEKHQARSEAGRNRGP
jgi:hypothetical protein